MGFCRVIAASKEGGIVENNYKFAILCMVSESGKIEPGEWFGYAQNENIIYPFVLKENGPRFICFYGGEEHYSESTNIEDKLIEMGALFTIFSKEAVESIYQIISIHRY